MPPSNYNSPMSTPHKYPGSMTAQQFDMAAEQTKLAPAKLANARRVLVDGMTAREVADSDGVELSTIFNALINVCARLKE